VVAETKALVAACDRTDVVSLAQGVVHWPPPPAAMRAAARLAAEAARGGPQAALLHAYGPTPGWAPLRRALARKMGRMGLAGYQPVVTPGANCAFTVALLALCDETDPVALFPPLYFNHAMSVQMTGGSARLMVAPLSPDLRPELDWLERVCASPNPSDRPRVAVLVNPSNPTGVVLSREELDRAARATAEAGAWLVVDGTYADFAYGDGNGGGGPRHYCPRGPNVVHVFSMSKAYGMMGWRVGWLALPPPPPEEEGGRRRQGEEAQQQGSGGGGGSGAGEAEAEAEAGAEDLGDGGALMSEILKVQDSVPICATQLSQVIALAALEGEAAALAAVGLGADADAAAAVPADESAADFGDAYVAARVADLARHNRPAVRAALSAALGDAGAVLGGDGGIFLFIKLPAPFGERARARASGDDDVIAWLLRRSGVCVLPGSACAAPGYLRVAFANLPAEACAEAAGRLAEGLAELVRRGPGALDDY